MHVYVIWTIGHGKGREMLPSWLAVYITIDEEIMPRVLSCMIKKLVRLGVLV